MLRKSIVTTLLAASALGAQAQTTTTPPTSVVLVHGAFTDGSDWAQLIPLLQAKGLHVQAVQNSLESLAGDAAATRRAIEAAPGKVVLVGHSWGGSVITEAGNHSKVTALVYVAAFAPAAGQSTGELGKDYPPSPGERSFVKDQDDYLSLTAQGVSQNFAQDLPAAVTQVMAASQGAIQARAFGERISVAAWSSKPSWYIVSEQDRMIPPALQRALAGRIKAKTTSLQTSHVPHRSRPAEVAQVILEAAGL
ncbi:alpha/beta fold hydrolase [Rugamonas sp. CCM 8940]|uniref:alpha/beta fold hydrolase n=1 Tax=Rugamonas sp. CCM 8940 TaxID=2765359 RepID=UPI0018F6F2FB|nr:alpha/beta hydrolase [Rugamonas sp. CCM 8940]MBJ7309332.1 alpha/beta hydrolase [Rugamonas sp. CCM 8940]